MGCSSNKFGLVPTLSKLGFARLHFVLTLILTLVSLLSPGDQVLTFKHWVYSWIPFAQQVNELDLTHHSDKIIHFFLFHCLGYLTVRGWLNWRQRFLLLLALLWLAPQTEWLQAYIPGRGASWADVLADVSGLAVGVVCAWVLHGRKRRAATAGGLRLSRG